MIDLGELLPETRVERLTHRGRRRLGRRGAVALVAVASLTLLSASAIAPAKPLHVVGHLPIGDSARLLIQGSRALIINEHDGRNEISAYALPGGRAAWTAELPGTADHENVFTTATTVIVSTDGNNVEALDLQSGAHLWTRAADDVEAIPAGLLILIAVTDPRTDVTGAETQLIDPATGAERWAVTIPDSCDARTATADVDIMASGILELCPATRILTAIDLTTGRVRAARVIGLAPRPPLRHSPANQDQAHVVYVGDVTIVGVSNASTVMLSGYRTSDLAPLWSGVAVPVGRDYFGCGPDICLDGAASVLAIDPLTGGRVATPTSADSLTPYSSLDIVGIKGFTTLVVVPSGQLPEGFDASLIDFESAAPAGYAVQLDFPSPGNTWVTMQATSRGRVVIRPVQLLTGVGAAGCTVIVDYLACMTSADRVTLWQLP